MALSTAAVESGGQPRKLPPLIPIVHCPNCNTEVMVSAKALVKVNHSAFEHIRHPQKKAYLSALVIYGGNSSRACEVAKVDRSTPYTAPWKEDKEFQAALEIAKELAVEVLEGEAVRRAFEGVDTPVTYKGEITASYKQYSDNLMMFTLKGARPEKYRERFEHTGANGGPIDIQVGLDFSKLDSRMLDAAISIAEGKADPDSYVVLTKDEYRRLTAGQVGQSQIGAGAGKVIDVTPRSETAQVVEIEDSDSEGLSVGQLPIREEW